MLFTTLPQLIVLVVLFLGGLILGLGLHPGGKKWRRRFKDESANYAQFRRDADLKMGDANRRIGELERELAALRARESASRDEVIEPEVMPLPSAPEAELAPAPAHEIGPDREATQDAGMPEEPRKSWFSMGNGQDLARIRGIDPTLKTRLFALGVSRFEDLTEMSDVDEIALEQRLSLPAGYITREQWRDQADLLRRGQDAEHAERFPPA